MTTWSLAVTALLVGAPFASQQRTAFRGPGRYTDPDRSCSIQISVSPRGGFARLHLPLRGRAGKRTEDDITGVVFVGSGRLAYSVSPVYGHPGIFVFDCRSGMLTRLVGPKSLDSAYPNGADYFELVSCTRDRLYFYYVEDVDAAGFDKLRSAEHLYTVELNGAELKRAGDQ